MRTHEYACDCNKCRPQDYDSAPEGELAERMDAAGYRYDGASWRKVIAKVERTARKDYPRIPRGSRYVAATLRIVDSDGNSRHYLVRTPVADPFRRTIPGVAVLANGAGTPSPLEIR